MSTNDERLDLGDTPGVHNTTNKTLQMVVTPSNRGGREATERKQTASVRTMHADHGVVSEAQGVHLKSIDQKHSSVYHRRMVERTEDVVASSYEEVQPVHRRPMGVH